MCWRVVFLFIEFDSAYCVGMLNGYLTLEISKSEETFLPYAVPLTR